MSPSDTEPAGVVLDLDGTMVDSCADITRALNLMLDENGEPPVAERQVARLLGEGALALVSGVLRVTTGVEPARSTVAARTRRYHELYAETPVRDSTLYPGVEQTLTALAARGVPLGVCTNKDEAIAVEVLRMLAVLPLVSVVVGGDTLPVRKPRPEPLLAALDELGAAVDRSLYVGDSAIDHECAHRAAVTFRLVPWAPEATPGHRMADFEEIVRLLDPPPLHPERT